MANMKEIQTRMKSVQDTMKITNAMYMISSSKLKKAKKALSDTEPYFYTLQQMIRRIKRHLPDIDSPFFDSRPNVEAGERRIGYLVITADKGLAGAYNHNIFKLLTEHLGVLKGKPVLYVVGDIGRQFFVKKGMEVEEDFRYVVQDPNMNRARLIAERVIGDFLDGKIDEVYMVYTRMVNAMKMEAEIEPLLPLKRAEAVKIPIDVPQENIVLKPTPEAVMDSIVPNYICGFIYGGLVESFSSEQNSRLMAMQSATDSAKNMLHALAIEYNRARQAAITQELTEVISGARAQKKKKKA